MRAIAEHARGFVYCVARKGVTGAAHRLLRRARRLPRALPRRDDAAARASASACKERADVDFLRGKVDIAVVGTESIRRMESGGVSAVRRFVTGLRPTG